MNWLDMQMAGRKFVHRKDTDWSMIQQIAWQDISSRLIVQENEEDDDIDLLAVGSLYFGTLPDSYARMRSVMQGTCQLFPTSYKALVGGRNLKPGYAISGNQIMVKGSSPLAIVYGAKLTPVLADSDENVVMAQYPMVALYGLIKHASLQAQDFDAAGNYAQQFDMAIDQANANYVDAAFGPEIQITADIGVV